MSASARITILTPVWNGLPLFKKCAESLLGQDFTDWEWIIGDNCSTDGTREYLDTLVDPRIRVIKHERNGGIYGNLNVLFREARTPTAFILCADDHLRPGGLATIVEEWAKAGDSVALIRFNWGEESRAKAVGRHSYDILPETMTPDFSPLAFFVFANIPGNLSNVAVRPRAVVDLGGCREDLPYAGDFDIWSRLAGRHSIRLSEREPSFVFRHPGVASNYLNRNGELVAEQGQIIECLFQTMLARGYPRWLLRLYATVNYDLRQRDAALRAALLKGKWAYLKQVQIEARRAPHALPNVICWLLYFGTGGARWGVLPIAKAVLRYRK